MKCCATSCAIWETKLLLLNLRDAAMKNPDAVAVLLADISLAYALPDTTGQD